jgi:hypothetical protein
MRRKTAGCTSFINGLHDYIVSHPQLRRDTRAKAEKEIQAELRPIVIRYLEMHFEAEGFKDYIAKANQSFYWEGQEGSHGRQRPAVFGARNYPDFIITKPYLVAIEYAQSPHGSSVKRGIGQSMIHTLCGEYDFVYYLFHDESADKRIHSSILGETESAILKQAWDDFNVLVRFI